MVEFDISDIKNLFKSTKLVIDGIKTYVTQRFKLTDLDSSPFSNDIPGTGLYDGSIVDINTSQERQKKREQRWSQGPTKNKNGKYKIPSFSNNREIQPVQKQTEKETHLPAAAAIVSRDDDDPYMAISEMSVSGYRIQVKNSSRHNKIDVARELSESRREIFLTSPEKNSNSTSVPLSSLSDIETSYEANSSYSDASWTGTDDSEDDRKDTISSFDSDVYGHFNEEVIPSAPILSSQAVSTRSPYSSSLDSSLYLNNNDSWSMYTTSDRDSSKSSAYIHGGASSSVGADDDIDTESDLKVGEMTPFSTEIDTKKTDSVHRRPDFEVIGSVTNDAEEHLETGNESSANFQEFQHDIDFLAKCTNKMSTPDKKSPFSTMDQNSNFKETGTRENSSVSSHSDSSKFQCDSSQSADQSSSCSSSHFVHGISPLCKAHKSNGKSHSAKYVRRRIIVLNRSFHDVSTNEVGENDLSATRTVFRRSTPKVRRRIIFTNGIAQSNNNSVTKEGDKCICPKSSNTSEKERINCIPTGYSNEGAFEIAQNGNTHSSELILHKCAFQDETEEAVYYLVTKYLENKECPW